MKKVFIAIPDKAAGFQRYLKGMIWSYLQEQDKNEKYTIVDELEKADMVIDAFDILRKILSQ